MIKEEVIPFSEKYRAAYFNQIKGQEAAIAKIKLFLNNFPKKRALILQGEPGTGKTTLAYVIANELNAEILELNASDFRDKERIRSILGPASQQMSLFKKNKVLLIDEIDGITNLEKGGIAEILSLIEKTSFPVIITANDIWDKKFILLREKAEIVQLKTLDYKTILKILEEVCQKENLTLKTDALISIAIKSKGDIRAALNDLQSLSKLEGEVLAEEIAERNKEETIFVALQKIFKIAKIEKDLLNVFENVNMQIDEIFLWIEENIPLEYQGEELYKAFDALSRADVFRGRIHRQQHWRFLIYENFFLGPAIAAVKKYNRSGFTSYRKPSRIIKIWLQNQRNAKKKSICEKYAKRNHLSVKRAMKDFLLIKLILRDKKIRKELKLTPEEEEFLDKPIIN
ncbi:MAG: replication factor C large subunit [Candidatus Pacearchaeota archaeon]